jgi:preflagellin peptidase FlaK
VFASIPDLLRLLAVPVFGWTAYRDVETRRVPNRTWLPLALLAFVALAIETTTVLTGDATAFARRAYLIRVAVSIGFVIPLAYAFWWLGGFGGADAKAFMVIAVLFPTFPTFYLPSTALPLARTTLGIFSLTILSNTVVAGLAYPLVLAGRNLLSGARSPAMFVAKPVAWDRTIAEYGRLFVPPAHRENSPSGPLSRLVAWRSGLDLDALRMYLQWRGTSLASVRREPDRLRDPDSLPEEPKAPGDGSFEQFTFEGDERATATDDGSLAADQGAEQAAADLDDPWGAEAFLDNIEGSAYGTTPADLRQGLETLAAEDTVWVSPGIPFLVPMFFGLLLALTYGDVLFVILAALGLG